LILASEAATQAEEEMLKGYKDWTLSGNVVHLAVGVVIGMILYNLISSLFYSLLREVIIPVFIGVVGKPDFSSVVFRLNGTPVHIGNFLNTVIECCFIALMLYFFLKLPLNSLMNRFNKSNSSTPQNTRPA
jgi:large conductance mechanosensitive channel